jgi:hypothetical protein
LGHAPRTFPTIPSFKINKEYTSFLPVWEEWGKSAGSIGNDDSDNPGGSDGDQSENPLG